MDRTYPHNLTPELVISKMLCIPTERVYNDMYQRSFSLGMSPGDAETMTNFFYQQGVDKNATLNLTSTAANLGGAIRYSATPTGKVMIPNGWSTQRLMFLLAVESIVNANTSITHYIQGFSEYHDATLSGILDPNAVFYINSITEVIRTRNPVTNFMDSRVSSTYNVIADINGGTTYKEAGPVPGMVLMRPSDIMTSLHANDLYSELDQSNISVRSTGIGSGGNVSKRTNNDPLKYFTDTINSVIVAKSTSIGYNTPEEVLSTANGSVTEQSITSNDFIYALTRLTGHMEPSSFTLNTLKAIDPSVDSKITLVNAGSLYREPTQHQTILDTDNTENMLNYTAETEIAQIFTNSLSSCMSENLITVISGMVTNANGASMTTISNLQSFLEGVDITPYGNRIINYVNAVIMTQLTMNGMRLVSIVFECDLLGDTTISISVDNGLAIVYRVPSFADSLYSPMITDELNKNATVSDFDTAIDSVMSMSPSVDTGVYGGY